MRELYISDDNDNGDGSGNGHGNENVISKYDFLFFITIVTCIDPWKPTWNVVVDECCCGVFISALSGFGKRHSASQMCQDRVH